MRKPLLERPVFRPSTPKPHGEFDVNQGPRDSLSQWSEVPDISFAGGRKQVPSADQISIPDTNRGRRQIESKARIALLESALVPMPLRYKGWFHVEHTPVHRATSGAWALFDELMDVWIDDLDRKGGGKIGQRAYRLPTDSGVGAFLAGANTKHEGAHIRRQMADHRKAAGPAADDTLKLPRPERSTAPEKENSLEQARLAGSIWAGNERQLLIESEIRGTEATKILDLNRKQRHQSSQRRIGMTTYRELVDSGACTRQLLLASVKPMAT
jgi:hypothetical protein